MRKLWIPLAIATTVSFGIGASASFAQDDGTRVVQRADDERPWGLLGLLGLAGLMGVRRKEDDRTHAGRTSPVTR